MPIAHVAELWRYPVKGMRGESVESLDVVADGIAGDRRYAFLSTGAPAGKPLLTGRERSAMLLYTAGIVDGQVFVKTPTGLSLPLDGPACLVSLEASLPQSNRLSLQRSDRPLTDCRPIALISSQAVERLSEGFGAAVDARRFRANIVLHFSNSSADRSCFPEDALVGHRIRIGAAAELRITERDPRCRIVTLDPETADPDPMLMKYLDRHHEGKLGVYAASEVCGTLSVGDPVWLCR